MSEHFILSSTTRSRGRAARSEARADALVQYDIHQLAAATHLSVRTIRAHQTRGLLAPPRRQGRRVVYGRRHLERLERIKALQQEGYNLAAIAAQFLPSR
ncbi:MAG: helix-turn-helix domain-containing protein, partial [Nocardioidaceae bacterium]|nr:helix-turn-helix domain-containing protein [Nocardioidaceae bacterium]